MIVRRRRALGVSAGLAALCATVGVTGGVGVAGPGLCDGQVPTIIVDEEFEDGTSGDDVILGTPGNDTVFGGAGNDRICGLGGNDRLDGEAGNDRLFGGDGDEELRGSDGDDHLEGGDDDDLIQADTPAGGPGDGDDTIYGGDGFDQMAGFDGDDVIYGGDEPATGENFDVLIGFGGRDKLYGEGGIDILVGDGVSPEAGPGEEAYGPDELYGGADEDSLEGGPGADHIDGGASNSDSTNYNHSARRVVVDLKRDIATGGEGRDKLVGIEDIQGSDLADELIGDGGDNDIDGRKGNDLIDGGKGFDSLYNTFATGGVTVNLAKGTTSGANGRDRFKRFEQALGGPHDDRLLGSRGDDRFAPGEGNDFVDGRAGRFDYISLEEAEGPVRVSLVGGTATGEGEDKLRGLELVKGTEFADILVGSSGDDGLFGEGGDDTLYGRDGSDTLEGGPGADKLIGGPGVLDLASWYDAATAVQADLRTGEATAEGDTDSLLEIEAMFGSRFPDELRGDDAENVIAGGRGDDLLLGRGGVDGLLPSPSPDTNGDPAPNGPIAVDVAAGVSRDVADPTEVNGDSFAGFETYVGTAGPDILVGDDDENVLIGLDGDDQLHGGGGDDGFDGGPGNDEMHGDDGDDVVMYLLGSPAIRANLGRNRVDSAGDRDRVFTMELLAGSPKPDVLLGSSRPEFLLGGPGKDRILGRGADDVLVGGSVDLSGTGLGPVSRGAARGGGLSLERLLDGGTGDDVCDGRPRLRCESTKLSDEDLDQLGRLIEILKDIRRNKGVRRRD